MKLAADQITVDNIEKAYDLVYERGWTDGIPVMLPTPGLVQKMLDYIKRDPQEVIGIVPPFNGVATIEKIAINAVMGGCKPEYMPVVISALEAMLEDDFNLRAIQTTTHCTVPLTIVNGPMVKELDFGTGDVTFAGSGKRANGGVGRALRLIRWNLGRAYPGETDRATMGHPGEYCYCIAEDEEANPWEPLHVERGLSPASNAVTVIGCEAPHHITTGTKSAATSLTCIASAMATLANNTTYVGGPILLVIGPMAAKFLYDDGIKSKKQIKQWLYENARVPVSQLKLSDGLSIDPQSAYPNQWYQWSMDLDDDNARVPVLRDPENLTIVVSGSWGAHSAFCAICPGHGYISGWPLTKEVKFPKS